MKKISDEALVGLASLSIIGGLILAYLTWDNRYFVGGSLLTIFLVALLGYRALNDKNRRR